VKEMRIRDFGIKIGDLPTGKQNKITDVPGVLVGHVTRSDGPIQTGVTAILPHSGNLFLEKVLATSHVINGFGKTIGTIQIEELGTIETPILLTNTLSVGTTADALVSYMLEQNPEIGVTTGTVNPIVGECNDMYLNDIRGQHVKKEDVLTAISNANDDFDEGAVGAGTGMSCYGLKGGIGSSSRVLRIDDQDFVLGVLVLSNFGRQQDLIVDGTHVGKWIQEFSSVQEDKGSIIILLATNLPLTERQLKRICKRCAVGLSRTGSFVGNGSGDLVIGFSTAVKIPHKSESPILPLHMLHEDEMDIFFRAAADATEESILNSMVCSEDTVGRAGHKRISLRHFMVEILKKKGR
jgi:D-aminopeptidase